MNQTVLIDQLHTKRLAREDVTGVPSRSRFLVCPTQRSFDM